MFIPRTHNGALVEKLRKVKEGLTGQGRKTSTPKLKLVEQAGTMLKSILTSSDPWASRPCQHPQCSTCIGERTGDCRVRLVVYVNSCSICRDKGKDSDYIGESARSMLERSLEHQRDALNTAKTSHIRTHVRDEHPKKLTEVLDVFRMNILKRVTSPLERQVREAVEIARAPAGSTLNLKEEYNRCMLPIMTIEGPKPLKTQELEHQESQVEQITPE